MPRIGRQADRQVIDFYSNSDKNRFVLFPLHKRITVSLLSHEYFVKSFNQITPSTNKKKHTELNLIFS